MPVTINVGLSKKLGLPDYGSLGASCNVQFEASHDMLDNLESFHTKVKNTFIACRQAVQDELARNQQAGNAPAPNGHTSVNSGVSGNGNGATSAATNGANGSHGNGTAANASPNGYRNGSNGTSGHPASEKQLGYAKQLAKSIQGLGIRRLESLSSTMFGKPLASLTSMDASGLIDTLRAVKDGRIDLNSVMEGNAA